MNGTLGHIGVAMGFLACVTGAVVGVAGVRQQKPSLLRQLPAYATLLLIGAVLAVIAMERALLAHDFSLDFVASNSSRQTPTLFLISGMWSALEGSILLWGFVLSVYIASMVRYFRHRRTDAMVAWATVVCFVVGAFFFALMLGPADPFRSVAGGAVPLNGPGPNPLLQNHPLMAFHPPILYAGYVGFTIPFAFGIAALITGRLGEGWLVEVRRWTLLSWGLLGTGIVLGSWWSYEVLGWGGYWAWDPVENASLLPWLTATAYLHSVMVQERRGMLRVWNLSLLAATFSLTILGTFFTRSGVLDSVHAFTESPLGPWLLSAFAVVVVATCALVFWRGDKLGSPGSIASPLSREAAFLANNVLFAGFAFVVLLGTVFPLLAEAINGDRISVGRPFFDGMTKPIGLMLLFLMAMAPVLSWRGGNRSVLANRLQLPFAGMVAVVAIAVALGLRGLGVVVGIGLAVFVIAVSLRQLVLSVRHLGWRGLTGRTGGGMIAHIGLAIIAVALVASQSFATRQEVQLKQGETATVDGHTFRLESLVPVQHTNRKSVVANVAVDGGSIYRPALSTFPNSTQAVGTPSVKSSFVRDIYLTLVRTPASADEPVVLSVIVQPLVSWLWFGGLVIASGTALALLRNSGGRALKREEDDGDALDLRETVAVSS